MDRLPVSVAALLIAEACNVGLTPVTDPNNPALTRERLSHVDQNYLRADTHSAAGPDHGAAGQAGPAIASQEQPDRRTRSGWKARARRIGLGPEDPVYPQAPARIAGDVAELEFLLWVN